MKKLAIVFIGLFLMTFAFQSVNAQYDASATSSADATIISPINIEKGADLSFGNIIASGTPGTVTVDNADARTQTGGATFPSVPGIISSAEFTVTGLSGSAYSITLPADNAITLIGPGGAGTDEMDLTDFTHNATETLTGGTETFKVGATLQVGADENAGAYTATFDVIVNYN